MRRGSTAPRATAAAAPPPAAHAPGPSYPQLPMSPFLIWMQVAIVVAVLVGMVIAIVNLAG